MFSEESIVLQLMMEIMIVMIWFGWGCHHHCHCHHHQIITIMMEMIWFVQMKLLRRIKGAIRLPFIRPCCQKFNYHQLWSSSNKYYLHFHHYQLLIHVVSNLIIIVKITIYNASPIKARARRFQSKIKSTAVYRVLIIFWTRAFKKGSVFRKES